MAQWFTEDEVRRMIAEAVAEAIAPLLTRIAALETENRRLMTENDRLKAEIAKLKKNSTTSSMPATRDRRFSRSRWTRLGTTSGILCRLVGRR